ncbi:MAG TPA: beta-N-acetylhexosaminidase, partial [Niabella sp.]
MKKKCWLLVIIVILCIPAAGQEQCPVIPAPIEAKATNASFVISKRTRLVLGSDPLNNAAEYLKQRLLDVTLIPLSTTSDIEASNTIFLGLDKKATAGDERYRLTITDNQIKIIGYSEEGVINGISSLLQLVMLSRQQNKKGDIPVAGWQISDGPRYKWRGFMLDESRHFMGKNKVLQLLDWMAFYKLNRFHWHLTDEPGWRIEIKRYPKLALLGGLGNFTNPTAPAAYYTQQEISEIVHYAAQRNITVIPEIDMPGHATAANRAYPQYSGGGNEQHPDFTFDPGNEGTYGYLMNILREVNLLFPSGMIHLGGDEVSFGTDKWAQHEGIQKLMQANALKDLKAVERYFMERMADSVYSLHSGLLVWDEMAAVNLPKDQTVICWWRHDQPRQLQLALDKGYRVIVCPRLPYYFDFVQDSSHRMGRKWGKGYAPIQDVYNYKVGALVKDSKQQAQVLGIQA